MLLPLKLIEEIVSIMLIAEKQPVLPGCTDGGTVLHKRAEGRDPRPRTNHDHGGVTVGGEAEILVRLHEHRNALAGFRNIRKEGGAHPFSHSTMSIVPHRRHGQVHLVGMRQRARCDRIKTDWQLAEDPGQRLRRKPIRSEIKQRIHDLAADDVFLQPLLRLVHQQLGKSRRAGRFRELLQDRLGKRGDIEILPERIGQQLFTDTLDLDLLGPGELGGVENLLDHRRAVHRLHGQSITRLVMKSATRQRKLDVDRFLARALAVEHRVVIHLGKKRFLFPILTAR